MGGGAEHTWLKLVHQLYNQCKLDEAHRSNFGLRWLVNTLTPGGVVEVYSHWYINRRDKFESVSRLNFSNIYIYIYCPCLPFGFLQAKQSDSLSTNGRQPYQN